MLICSMGTPACRPSSAYVRRRSCGWRFGFPISAPRFWTMLYKAVALRLFPGFLFLPKLRRIYPRRPMLSCQSRMAAANRVLMGTARSLAPLPTTFSTYRESCLTRSSKSREEASSRLKPAAIIRPIASRSLIVKIRNSRFPLGLRSQAASSCLASAGVSQV